MHTRGTSKWWAWKAARIARGMVQRKFYDSHPKVATATRSERAMLFYHWLHKHPEDSPISAYELETAFLEIERKREKAAEDAKAHP